MNNKLSTLQVSYYNQPTLIESYFPLSSFPVKFSCLATIFPPFSQPPWRHPAASIPVVPTSHNRAPQPRPIPLSSSAQSTRRSSCCWRWWMSQEKKTMVISNFQLIFSASRCTLSSATTSTLSTLIRLPQERSNSTRLIFLALFLLVAFNFPVQRTSHFVLLMC